MGAASIGNQASVSIAWRERQAPLEPRAALGLGEVARSLGARLLRMDDASLSSLEAVAAEGALLVIGEASALPWVDGVLYLGREPLAPSLLLPTALSPSVHPALLERALSQLASGKGGPWAVSVSPPRLVPAGGARRIARDRLSAFVEGGAW